MTKDAVVLRESKSGLTAIIRTVGVKSRLVCEACGTQLRGLKRVLIHPADAVVAFSYWKEMATSARFQFDTGAEVNIVAREWVERGEAIFELMDGTFHEFEYSPRMTQLETQKELTDNRGIPQCVGTELEDEVGHDSGEDYGFGEEDSVV